MEAFEHVAKVYLEAHGYVVTSGVKFPIRMTIRKKTGRIEHQKHGYEVDLVAARRDRLLLCSVKSFFGSAGVSRNGFSKLATQPKASHLKRYAMFNDRAVLRGIIRGASARYGYSRKRICLALFAGKFHANDEAPIRKMLGRMKVGPSCVEVIGPRDLATTLLKISLNKTHLNDPVIVTLKVLQAAKLLVEKLPTLED